MKQLVKIHSRERVIKYSLQADDLNKDAPELQIIMIINCVDYANDNH